MISDEMRVDILHAVFINKNFIKDEENCNYEKYLLELVNKSIYFRENQILQNIHRLNLKIMENVIVTHQIIKWTLNYLKAQ